MSISSLVGSLNIPVGQLGSFFVDPNAAALAAQTDLQSRMSTLMAGVPSVNDMTASFSSVVDSTTAYTTEKLSKIKTELPTMLSVTTSVDQLNQRIAQADNILTPSVDAAKAAIDAAFPPGLAAVTVGCPSINDAFKALTEGVTDAFDSVTAGIEDMFNTMSDTLKDALEAVMGPIADGKAFVEELLKLPQAAISALGATITSLVQTVQEVADEMAAKVTGMVDAAKQALEDFAAVVESEAKALLDAVSTLINVNFMSMFNSTNDCVKQLMGKVSNPAVATPEAMTVATTPPTEVEEPTSNAIAVAASGAKLEERPIVSDTKIPPPTQISNKYTDSEIDALKEKTLPYYDEMQTKKKEAAVWLKSNVEDWKVAVDYQGKQVAAGATTANPEGTSTDKAAIAAWDDVYKQYQPKRNTYNNDYAIPANKARALYQEVYAEFNSRKQFGKTPYTNMAARGFTIPADRQTTFLDSGK